METVSAGFSAKVGAFFQCLAKLKRGRGLVLQRSTQAADIFSFSPAYITHTYSLQPLAVSVKEVKMLKWALIFAVVAMIAGVLGFSGIAAGAAGIAKFLFVVFLVLFAAVVLLGVFGVKALGKK